MSTRKTGQSGKGIPNYFMEENFTLVTKILKLFNIVYLRLLVCLGKKYVQFEGKATFQDIPKHWQFDICFFQVIRHRILLTFATTFYWAKQFFLLFLPTLCVSVYHSTCNQKKIKIDGIGPVDNRPSTDQFHPFGKELLGQQLPCEGVNFWGRSVLFDM